MLILISELALEYEICEWIGRRSGIVKVWRLLNAELLMVSETFISSLDIWKCSFQRL
jgi:hypothetical protein